MDFSLRIMIQTANGSRKVVEELKSIAIDENIDVVIIHTPPVRNNKIPGYNPPIYTITGVNNSSNVNPQTVIAIFKDGLQVTGIPELSNDFCILLQLVTATPDEIYLISLYCPKNMDINSCLKKLQELLQFIGDKQVILCVDSNAKSCWWSNSGNSDDRGEILEDFIITNGLCVLNSKDPLGENYRRSDYTDVTLATNEIMQKFTAWQAHDDWTSGNIRTVAMEIDLKGYSSEPIRRSDYIDGNVDSDSSDTVDEQEDRVANKIKVKLVENKTHK